MSEPWTLYPDRISDRPQTFEGTLPLDEFPRLQEYLANTDGKVSFVVTARLDGQRRKVVSCIIEGFVFLTCQKSLEAFRQDIRLEDRLVLVDREAELPPIEEESETEDYLVAVAPLDVRDLVEDAVILALPMVPRKPGLEAAEEKASPPPDKESPFAALAKLRRPKQ